MNLMGLSTKSLATVSVMAEAGGPNARHLRTWTEFRLQTEPI